MNFYNSLWTKKWISLFLYKCALPVSIIALFTLYAMINSASKSAILFQVAFDGQLGLISILLILSTWLELDQIRVKREGFLLVDLWVFFVFLLLLFYACNKVEVLKGIQPFSIRRLLFNPVQVVFALANLFLLVTSPIYCFICILTTPTEASTRRVL
jgi:hypothetical protein